MTPPATKNLIIINIILFLALGVGEKSGFDLSDTMGLHFIMAPNFNPLQFITYMFMHASFSHIAFNMFSLWMFGRIIESVLGTKKFIIYYMVCGIGAGLCQEAVQFASYYAQGLDQYQMVNTGLSTIPMEQYLSSWTTVGASGAVYGILLAYGMLFPNERVMLLIPPIPMKAKYMIMGFIVIELILALANPGDSIAHFAHIGGAFAGWIMIRLHRKREQQRYSGFTTWEEYNPDKKSFKEKISNLFHSQKKKQEPIQPQREEKPSIEDLNDILSKIKKSGYDSLTAEEKEKLFKR